MKSKFEEAVIAEMMFTGRMRHSREVRQQFRSLHSNPIYTAPLFTAPFQAWFPVAQSQTYSLGNVISSELLFRIRLHSWKGAQGEPSMSTSQINTWQGTSLDISLRKLRESHLINWAFTTIWGRFSGTAGPSCSASSPPPHQSFVVNWISLHRA